MTRTVLFTVAALAAFPSADAASLPGADSRFQAALQGDESVVRGQSGGFTGPTLGTPQPVTTYYQTPTYTPNGGAAVGAETYSGAATPMYSDPTFGGMTTPGYGNAAPYTSDPFLGGGMDPYGGAGSPYPGTAPGAYTFGLNGPQPYKYGWTERLDAAWIAEAGTNAAGGDVGVFELNYEKDWVTPIFGNWIFMASPQYNLRQFDGPFSPRIAPGDAFPAIGGRLDASGELPGDVHRFGLGLKLATPSVSGWQFEFGFNPALTTDFEAGIGGESWLFDGHAVAFWRWSPTWMWAAGAAYWDRVDSMIVPIAGAVWTPNDYLEVRLLFPKPRVSLFVGTPMGTPTWLYVQGEYHVEAYQMDVNGAFANDTLVADGLVQAGELRSVGSTRVQLSDWRVMGGLYQEGAWVSRFIEAGVVLDREVEYESRVRGFDIDSAFLLRAGVRY